MSRSEATATVHLVGQLTPAGGGMCALYSPGDRAPSGWRVVDVRARCHRHQDGWQRDLTAWHAEMMTQAAAANPWSWLLPGSRIHVWHPQIRPLLFALGLNDFFREHRTAEVWATRCPPEVGDYIAELSGGSVRVVRHERQPSRVAARAIAAARALADAAVMLRRVPLRARAAMPVTGADVVVYSIALSERSVRERGDHFFGRALDEGPLKVHWLYQLAGSAGRAAIEEAVRQTGRSVTWAHECIGWREAWSMFRTAARVRRDLRSFVSRVPPLSIDGVTSRTFARRYVEQLLVSGALLDELTVFRATVALLRAANPAAICYPYEEKGLEHAIAMASRATTGCRTIGFAHAAYSSGHLYLQAWPAHLAPPPRPRALAAAGRGLGDWVRSEFGRHDGVAFVGSPRWAPAPETPGGHTVGQPLRVLVVTGFGYELEAVADWIDEQPHLFDGMAVTIRPHPHRYHPREQAVAIERLGAVAGVTLDARSSLEAQVAACDVVVFCTTSTAAEAIGQGRVAVYAEWNDLWTIDPLKGKKGEEAVKKCGTPAALRRELLTIGAMSRERYAQLLAAQRVVASHIYGPFEPDRFREVVMESIPA